MSTNYIYTHRGLLSDSVTKWKRTLLEKPVASHLVKNFSLIYGAINFINVFTSEIRVLTPVTVLCGVTRIVWQKFTDVTQERASSIFRFILLLKWRQNILARCQ
jgi:hypothetical protein